MARFSLRRRRPAPEPPPEPPTTFEPPPLDPDVPLAAPEAAFARRMPPPEAERPLPSSRRAIFFDVENTSRPEHIARLIEHLGIDRMGRRTEFVAVGNWRVIGSDTARLLAKHGAQLIHSAPATGVRDWSDLRIAVSAGVWLAAARPGDVLEIVTEDRAFDAVGDVAAALGIAYRRLSFRRLVGAPAAETPVEEPAAAEPRAPRGRRGRGRGRGPARGRERVERVERVEARPVAHEERPHREPAPHPAPEGAAHTAPHDEIVEVVRELIERNGGQPIVIDTLANALKARGFSRPPGSPRLITRLRRIHELDVSARGMIGLTDGAAPPSAEAEEPAAVEAAADGEAQPAGPRRRRSRRGGRRHRRRGPAPAGDSAAG